MATAIVPVATIQLPTASRILHASWCPDKDLLVVISRMAHQEKMTLYKMQGSKKWEVTIQPSNVGKVQTEVVGVAWSPDGKSIVRPMNVLLIRKIVQSIAVISNPAMISIHSIQNGAVERSIPLGSDDRRADLKAVWWFLEEKKVIGNGLPDIFKRGENIVSGLFLCVRPSRHAEGRVVDGLGSCHFERSPTAGPYSG